MTLIDPEDTFLAPVLADPAPPTGLPVIFIVPVEALFTPKDDDAAPPVGLPVIFKVPVLVLVAPCLDPVVADPTGFPIIVAEFPVVPE